MTTPSYDTDFYTWTQAQAAVIREDAAIDTDLPLTTFPQVYPWPVEQLLDADFWPAA